MNLRHGGRLSVQLEVIIHRNGQRLGQFQTRDISLYGVFLETDATELRLGESVDLTFILSEQPLDRRKVKGMVIRRSSDGAGFMLADGFHLFFSFLKQQSLHTPAELLVRTF